MLFADKSSFLFVELKKKKKMLNKYFTIRQVYFSTGVQLVFKWRRKEKDVHKWKFNFEYFCKSIFIFFYGEK